MRGPELRDIGLQGPQTVVAGDGYAVVAVQDEVRVSQLVQAHRRKVHTPVERQIHALPPIAGTRAKRREAPVEVPTASHAADISFGSTTRLPLRTRLYARRDLWISSKEGGMP